jgi:HAD superfamily hydrolase (TIGR01509 family)
MADRVNAMKYRCAVFDFFGVISDEVAPPWLAGLFPAERVKEIRDTLFVAADRGDISQDELFAQLTKLTGVGHADLLAEWNRRAKVDPAMVALIRGLRGKCRLGLLTNAAGPFVRSIIDAHALEPLFDAVIVSAEVRMAKPEPAIFRAMLDKLTVTPGDAVMIDDNPANIAAAAALGMHTILFRSCAQLERELGIAAP